MQGNSLAGHMCVVMTTHHSLTRCFCSDQSEVDTETKASLHVSVLAKVYLMCTLTPWSRYC